VDRVGAISPDAWKGLTFISDPKCAQCGIPFSIDTGPTNNSETDFLCAGCLASPRPYDAALSVFTYNEGSRAMILAFKHSDKIHLHTTLAPLLHTIAQHFIKPDTIFIPVPIHWLRLLKRRYNQSAILAEEIAKLSDRPHWPDALIRTRHTPPQGHKNVRDRRQNVAHAFDLNPNYVNKIRGKNIILVDDVFTTGATLEECAKVLKAAGAETIYIVTIARVVKE
jgi:ComF family protein